MNKGNLLLIDDEPILVQQLKYLLKDTADTIFTAENGLDAIEILGKETIHCVLCDINMPKMNGIQVISTIRSKNNHVPFIFYTGHGNHDLMLEAVKYGAFDFLNKPNLDGVEEVIKRGLKRGTNTPEELASNSDFISEYQKLLDDLDS